MEKNEMAVNANRITEALETSQHSQDEIRPVVRRILTHSDRYIDYMDTVESEAYRQALSELSAEERQRRTVALASCWDGKGDLTEWENFARMCFADGVENYDVWDDEQKLNGTGFAPISWPDVLDLMRALFHINGTGEHLAACLAYAAFGVQEPHVFEWFREISQQLGPTRTISMTFRSLPEVNDRLLALVVAHLDEEGISVESFIKYVPQLSGMGAQDAAMLGACCRWLEAQGAEPIVRAIELRNFKSGSWVWDGGHALGANAVHAFLARVWSVDADLIDVVAQEIFDEMEGGKELIGPICSNLPFGDKFESVVSSKFRRIYRQGRLMVSHTGKVGARGRVTTKLHKDVAKAEKDFKKKEEKEER